MVAIIVHGGAWNIPEEAVQAHRDGCLEAVRIGHRGLQEGCSALDAVEAAVRSMEDDPTFDAGRGSFLNQVGEVEMDAIIMNGDTLEFGAVAAVQCIRHPVTLARRVMEETEHCMLVGRGARRFARRIGMEIVPTAELLTPRELEAVIAHEISHVRNRDVLTLTIASFVAMIAALVMNNFLFAAMFNRRDSGNAWIIAGIVAVVVYFIAQLLIMALSRYREFAADPGSAYITGSPKDLISALGKISGRMAAVPPQQKQAVETANAFFIIPALSGSILLELFSTHPPLEKRIAALEQVELELQGLA
jgi:hypothetical protein